MDSTSSVMPLMRKRSCLATNALAEWMLMSHPRHRNARSSRHTANTGFTCRRKRRRRVQDQFDMTA